MTMGRDLVQDLRFAARTLARRPAFSLVAVLILGLGIGAPTTVFTLVDTVFFQRPEHVAEPHRLVRLYRSWAPGEGGGALQNPDYEYYRRSASTLSGLAAYGGMQAAAWSLGEGRSDQLQVLFTSDTYFHVLGVPMALGRGFRAEENTSPGAHPVVVVSHGFWTRSLGAEEDVVGSSLRLNGRPYTVVGVAPEGFTGVSPVEAAPDAWVPIAMFGDLTRTTFTAWWERLPTNRTRWLSVVGRMAPGVTFEAARANLTALSDALTYDGKDPDEGILVEEQFLYRPSQYETLADLSRMLLAVVAIVLIIATANVAVLLLSRATTRTRETGIRVALGAGRGRLLRQHLTEALLLGAAGGILGVGLAYGLADVAATLLPLPFTADFRPDASVLVWAAAASLLTALGVGAAPALQSLRTDVRSAIHDAGARRTGGALRNVLVIGQVALSLTLVAGALLFGSSFRAASTQDVGFATEDRLVVQVNLQGQGYEPDEGVRFIARGLERLRALPGVRSATTSRMVPFQGDWTTSFDAPPGAVPNDAEGQVLTGTNVVAPNYFQVAAIPILRGRPLGEEDVQGAPPALVVNETLAEAIWPGLDPLGRTLPLRDDMDFTVVGVARTATYYELGEEPFPQVYGSVLQLYQSQVAFLVHTEGPAPDMAPAVQNALREMDPTLAFSTVTTLEAVLADQVARYRVTALLVSLFAALALVLAAAGLYGVISFLVALRTRDIGVRMALGAGRGRVAGQVVRFATRLAASGILLGLLGALLLRGFTESLLYQVEPTDPLPLVGACAALLLVTVGAALAPARRALRVDPVEAMRVD